MKSENESLPIHSLQPEGFPFSIQELGYRNPYDFTREHRHTYFEIFLVEKGGGSQLIDFVNLPLQAHSAYIVFPQQIHLLKKGPQADGLLLQFPPEILPSDSLKLLLDQFALRTNAAVIFENQPETHEKLRKSLNFIQETIANPGTFAREVGLLQMQAFLYQLLEINYLPQNFHSTEPEDKLAQFQLLLEDQFRENRAVSNYAEQIGISDQKLSKITRERLGMSPLQVIHNRLLLEIKRMLGFEKASFKEISYALNFDSPAAFSQFVRSKTSQTPTDLRNELIEIHK
ncbi:MAG: helix-turn-helix domain-containing protein [Bacteroidia bacterium]|nr:helix-turn-helix domain-containing protein [Bacteroidia bacterium]